MIDAKPAGRAGNVELAALIAASGRSHAQVARVVVQVATELGAAELTRVGRSHVTHWVAGTIPTGRGAPVLAEAMSRLLGRPVTRADLGLPPADERSVPASVAVPAGWQVDSLALLAELGSNDVDVQRRRVLEAAAYSLTALAVPDRSWWQQQTRRVRGGGIRVGPADVETVQDMTGVFSRMDQRRGGGHARTAVAQYLTADVLPQLRGTFTDDAVRRGMFSAAAELAYLCGWMAFDNAEHPLAQRYFIAGVKLAAEADDPPLAGHILRAMAHQALDLGHRRHALDLAEASIDGDRYRLAASRERALLGVVHARTLAAAGEPAAATAALNRAETDLAAAEPSDDEPARVFFFAEASLAHETACTLRDLGDLTTAAREFRRSVRTRKSATFTRTHAVTLGYLGAVQVRQGNLDQACATWNRALDAMDGIRSGRTRQVALDIRSAVSPYWARGSRDLAAIDERAAAYLSRN